MNGRIRTSEELASAASRFSARSSELLTLIAENGEVGADLIAQAAASAAFCHQMASAAVEAAVFPSCGEAQRVEFGLEHLSDRPDAGKIHGAAVDVDRFLQQGHGPRIFRRDMFGNRRFGFIARLFGIPWP